MKDLRNMKKNESKNVKLKCVFDDLKSDYFLQNLLNGLKENKSFEIIKYNNKIKKRLNITNNNYKEYTDIKIEIVPDKNEYGQFINIKDEDKLFYHIYFNNDKEEINRNFFTKDDNITKINIIIDYQVISFENLFSKCYCIKSIYFTKFNRKNIINMSGMFLGCSSLKEINLSNFKTNKVTDMSNMFFHCSSLKEVSFSKFITNNVNDMSGMFNFCSKLEEINISNFNTSNVTDMSYMFSKCLSLKEINLSNFNTKNVTNMYVCSIIALL